MTEKSRPNLKSTFQNSDIITEEAFIDLIDSCLNLVDTTAQQFSSPVVTPGITVTTVSAANMYATNTFGESVTVSAAHHKNPFIELTNDSPEVLLASLYQSSAADSETPRRLSANTTAHLDRAFGFGHAGGGTIAYQAATSAKVYVEYNLRLISSSDGVAHHWNLYLFKNSAKQAKTQMRFSTIPDQYETVQVRGVIDMATNDNVHVYACLAETNGSAVLHIAGIDAVAFPIYWKH